MFEDHLVTQDIIDDPERNTVLTVVGQVDNFKELKSSVNLHDFNAVFFFVLFWFHDRKVKIRINICGLNFACIFG